MGLDPHTLFGAHEDPGAVNMRMEGDALFLDLSKICQGEHLKTAGIGKDRFVPSHERVQAAKLINGLIPRTYVQVIGIAKRDLRINTSKVIGTEAALNSACRRDIHKNRGLDRAMDSLHMGSLRHPLPLSYFIFHFCHVACFLVLYQTIFYVSANGAFLKAPFVHPDHRVYCDSRIRRDNKAPVLHCETSELIFSELMEDNAVGLVDLDFLAVHD